MQGRALWTKALSEEFWTGVVTPLMFSIAGGLIEDRMAKKGVRVAGLKQLEKVPFLRLFRGQVYQNSKILEEIVKRIPSVLLTAEGVRFLPDSAQNRLSQIHVSIFSPKTLGILFRLFREDVDWVPFWNYKAFERGVGRLEEVGRVRCRVDEGAFDDSQLLERSRILYEEMGDFLDVVTWGMFFAYVARPLTDSLAEKWGQDTRGDLSGWLRVGLDGIKTFEINREIETLAEEVGLDPYLNGLFDGSSAREILENLRRERKATKFLKRFEAFQEKNGHRFHGRDICHPTWRERPETVIEWIKMNRGSDLCRRTFALQREKRMRAEKVLKGRIKGGVTGPIKRTVFSLILSYDRKYFLMRENMRYHADIFLEQFRRLYLEIGRRWQARGILERPEDIVFLSREEIEEACGKNTDVSQAVESRKRKYDRYRRLQTPKVTPARGDAFASVYVAGQEGFELDGEVASPGYVTGSARIIREPMDLLKFNKGEILVAQYADPSWTPALSLAAGLIFEVGGFLSHGSIVAREYGIPALIQVEGAMERIRTGDRLDVDTERKRVRVGRDEGTAPRVNRKDESCSTD